MSDKTKTLKQFTVYSPSVDVALHKAAEEAREWLQMEIYEAQRSEQNGPKAYAELVFVGLKVEIIAHGRNDDLPEWTFELRCEP